MAERARPTTVTAANAVLARARPAAVSAASAPAQLAHPTATSVRRNLFQSQLTRRPTPSSSNSAETLLLDMDFPVDDTSEIVVRDERGEISSLGDPPAVGLDEPDAAEERQEHESMASPRRALRSSPV
jgi:hypothetical protein